MKKYKFGICGAFDFEEQTTGGQTIKTREFYYQLRDTVGNDEIKLLESTSYKLNPLRFLVKLIAMYFNCQHLVIFPAQNGIRIMAPLLSSVKRYHGAKLHYSVIGGWLPELLKEKKKLTKSLCCFDSILVETSVMQQQLETQGLRNVFLLKNFKRLNPIAITDVREISNPIKLCYFSRVIKQKGIEDAIEVVSKINHDALQTICTFDIYGPIVPEYKKDFTQIIEDAPEGVHYCGTIMPNDSVKVLKEYDLQLFPTQYSTEGIPGSIVDSYFAGVPVVASKWNSFSDVIIENVTGVGYRFNDLEDFFVVLLNLLQNTEKISNMKLNCLEEAKRYSPNIVQEEFFYIIGYKIK